MLTHPIVLGVDIGGTNTKFGLVDERGKIVFHSQLPTAEFENPAALLESIKKEIECFNSGITISGVGIGAPNANYTRGTIEYAPNLKWKGIVPLAEMATAVFNTSTIITNDANAAAIGEMKYGAAKNMQDFIVITLGTGVGGGVVSNGKLVTGKNGFAGELGHVTVIPNGRMHPSTGLKGSLEAYASATGIVETAKQFLSDSNQDSLLRDVTHQKLTCKMIFETAHDGDLIAQKTIEFTAQILGLALSNFVLFSAPEAVILFGGVVSNAKNFIASVKNEMEKHLITVFKNSIPIIRSALPESEAAILGAAALVCSEK